MSYADEIAVVRDSLHRTRVGGGPVAVGDAIRIVELVEVLRQRLDALASKVHAADIQAAARSQECSKSQPGQPGDFKGKAYE